MPEDRDTSLSSEAALPDYFDAVYQFVRSIPPGKVVTYGQAADLISEIALTARQVGSAMRWAPSDVPWHRVVGAGGHLPVGKRDPEMKLLQIRLLKQEGVRFIGSSLDRVDMEFCL